MEADGAVSGNGGPCFKVRIGATDKDFSRFVGRRVGVEVWSWTRRWRGGVSLSSSSIGDEHRFHNLYEHGVGYKNSKYVFSFDLVSGEVESDLFDVLGEKGVVSKKGGGNRSRGNGVV